MKGTVHFILFKLPVYHNIQIIYNLKPLYLLPYITGIKPDRFTRIFLSYLLRKSCHSGYICLMKRISAGKSNAAYIILIELRKDLLLCLLVKGKSPFRSPGNRIIAARTGVRSACHPQNYPKSVAVQHIVLRNIMITHDYRLFLSAISAIFASFSRVSPFTLE